MNTSISFLLVLGLLLASCAGPMQADFQSAGEPQTGAQVAGNQAASSIGTIERIQDSIFHNQIEVEDVEALYANDSLFVEGGGEGILELADRLRMRIFNTTRLGGITIEDEPGTPLFIRIYLELGGFTGEFASLNGETVFDTPGGAVIRIQGTQFFIVYDGNTRTTFAGNFDGSVTIESGGSGQLDIRPGTMRRAQAGSPPGPEEPIPFTQVEYEQRARDLQSPVEPLNLPGDVVSLPQGETQPPPPAQNLTEPPPLAPVVNQPTTQAPPPPAAQPPTAEVIQNAFCRTGPSQVFEAEDSFLVGVRLDVDGRLADSTWWRVITPDGRKNCWISSILISLSGDLDSVPVLASPPTPTPQPSPTPTSTPTITSPPPTEPPIPEGPADLLPVADSFGFCNLDSEGNLVVTVHNGEGYNAGPSVTYVIFEGGEDYRDTPSLGPGESVNLYFSIPSGCFSPDCSFTIVLDVYNEVDESNEDNNSASDSCIG